MTGYTHKLGKTYSSDMGTIASTSQTFSGAAQSGVDKDVVAGSTDLSIPLAVTKTKIVSMCLSASQAIRVCTNAASTGSPQETINLTAGQQLEWDTTAPATCPFAGNVTGFYVTNAGAVLARFRFEVLLSD